MSKPKQSIEEVNTLLFDDEEQQSNASNFGQPESQSRLLKQRGLSSDPEELDPVPYYKKPGVQIAVLSAIAIPFVWGLFSAFSPVKPNPQLQTATNSNDKENQQLRESLATERKKNRDLAIEKGLRTQQMEVIPVKTELAPQPKPVSSPEPVRSQRTPTSPRTVPIRTVPIRRISSPHIPRNRPVYASLPHRVYLPPPTPKLTVPTPMEPKLDPMEQWLIQANKGHYVAAQGSSSERSNVQTIAYTPDEQTDLYSSTDADSEPSQSPGTAALNTAVPLDSSVPLPQQTASSYPVPEQQSSFADSASSFDANSSQFLDLGSSAEAELEMGIAWTEQGGQQNRNYLLRLEEGFKNSTGKEVLPKGTRLIAQVTETTNSGLFSLEVTHILRGSGQEKVPVSPGVLQVMAEDGSPLMADKERKGGSNFWANVGTIFAPGVEQAMDSLADSAESLILEDGDRSLIRTGGSSNNPVAAGLSGVAKGASQVFSQQLGEKLTDKAASYFQFDSGSTVRIVVNEDLFL